MVDEKEDQVVERYETLRQLEGWLEGPVTVLGFVWLVLLLIEFIWGLNSFLNATVYAIWLIFIIDFGLRLFLAPHKARYLQKNWLTALSLALPALRVFRVARAIRLLRLSRTTRSLSLVRTVSSVNRVMNALKNTMSRRGFGYVLLLSVVVTLAGAAGIFALENVQLMEVGGFQNYGEALWWTAMILTTLGSDYWPQTAEGRVLTFLLSLYALGVFGYVTAAIASFFIGRDAENEVAELAGQKTIENLQTEVRLLRAELRAFSDRQAQ